MWVIHDQAVRFLSFVNHYVNLHSNLKTDSDVTRRLMWCSDDEVVVVKTSLSLGSNGLLPKLIFEHTESKMNNFAKPLIVTTIPPSLIMTTPTGARELFEGKRHRTLSCSWTRLELNVTVRRERIIFPVLCLSSTSPNLTFLTFCKAWRH